MRKILLDIYLPLEQPLNTEAAASSVLLKTNRVLADHGATVLLESVSDLADYPQLTRELPAVLALGKRARHLFCAVPCTGVAQLLKNLADLPNVYARVSKELMAMRGQGNG